MTFVDILRVCPGCGHRGAAADEGHVICLVCEGRACREHGRLDINGRCRQCEDDA